MSELVDTLIEDERWHAAELAAAAERACRATLTHLEMPTDGFEISLLGCDDARIADLNRDFRDKPTATNVLSWPSEDRAADDAGAVPDRPEPGPAEMPEELGDIAIAYETCQREATEQGKDFGHHVAHLLVHACLHLLGYDHIRTEDAALMEQIEVEILATLGVNDPYV